MIGDNKEIALTEKDMIVSSTDRKGFISYANDLFCDIAGYDRSEVIGKPHNIIRHPDMPKAIFELLWSRILNGEVIYAFVKNRTKNGDYYWVKAYVKPIVKNGEVVKVTSYRKSMNEFAKKYIINLYGTLLEYEKTHTAKESSAYLLDYIGHRNLTYDQFIDRLSLGKSVENIVALNTDFMKFKNSYIMLKAGVVHAVESGGDLAASLLRSDDELEKWFLNVEKEGFAKTAAFKTALNHHGRARQNLEEYVYKASQDASQNKLDAILKNVDAEIGSIFENLKNLVDVCKE